MGEEEQGDKTPPLSVLEAYDESLDVLFKARENDNQDVVYQEFLKHRKHIQEYQKLIDKD